jgi:hypothetical protein
MVRGNYCRVIRLASDELDRMAEDPRYVKLIKKIILKGGIKYESCGKFKWDKFRFTN